MPLDKVNSWFSESNISVLIGAGCSACAGKPLMKELTEKVKPSLTPNARTLLDGLKECNQRAATIEDLLDCLIKYRGLIEARKEAGTLSDFTLEGIKAEISAIQKQIVEVIGRDWTESIIHQGFFRRLASVPHKNHIDIFSLNYDTLIEASLEKERLGYIDSFIGGENAFFAPASLEYPPPRKESPFRVFKLHGSINWTKDGDGIVRRTPQNETSHERIMIYPCEQKYVQSQYGVYEILMGEFRKKLKERTHNNHLITLGYSFNDEHINVAILDAIQTNPNLTVIAFVGEPANPALEKARFEPMVSQCGERLNILLGNTCFLGGALVEEEFEELKAQELWKFENLSRTLTGG